ncbi:MAG: CDP-alcohol phosphatidyltransferase family protein [Bacteroidales bacterium]|jgi:CDP-diacylglycerol--serine O-phosphatidyltransferase|nr:CDP-alcohol phosphatidyltransferase family protein [Bacteroidales bacterium]MBR4218036.1 CDP-alcohol phosphatidyltransferase family protein [Bacteroidales bacterium]
MNLKKHIPNTITCLNLITGCISVYFAFSGNLVVASLLILLSATFDFFDGFSARLLGVHSEIGIDMDSLADVISFGFAPAAILFMFMDETMASLPPAVRNGVLGVLPFCAFIVPALSAVRLARFNHDETQRTEFKGLATPANALFLGYLHFSANQIMFLNNFWILLILMFSTSLLMLAPLPMFSLKFHHLRFKENEIRYIFLALSLILLIIFRLGAFPIIIITYIILSFSKFAMTKIHPAA